ncbi:MAG: hypothetical protein IT245_09305 [Bacteroidia bacterium]|nr:hypothetical protein [Bacteroidia bacterium]
MKKYSIIALGLILLSFNACKEKEPDPQNNDNTTQTSKITLKFNPVFKGSPIAWDNFYVNGSNDSLNFDKVKYIMSNFILEKENGDLYQIPDAFAYLSLKDGRDSVVFSNIPKGKYNSIRFTVGLDSVLNHSDPTLRSFDHPLSPALNEMHWGWAGGYIFNVLEGYYKSNGANLGYTFHIALVRNARTHLFNNAYEISKDGRFVFNVNLDKYFDNQVNFSLKNDGAFSHSGDVDPVMDKFIQNMNGIFDFISYK